MQAAYETRITRAAGNPGGERHQPARLLLGKGRNLTARQLKVLKSYLDEGRHPIISLLNIPHLLIVVTIANLWLQGNHPLTCTQTAEPCRMLWVGRDLDHHLPTPCHAGNW